MTPAFFRPLINRPSILRIARSTSVVLLPFRVVDHLTKRILSLIVFFAIILLSCADLRSDSETDPKAGEGSEVTQVSLPEPDWTKKFPEYDAASVTSMLPALHKSWQLPELAPQFEKTPAFEVSLFRAGVAYDAAVIVVARSN